MQTLDTNDKYIIICMLLYINNALISDPVFSSQVPTNIGIDVADAPIFVDGPNHSPPSTKFHTRGPSTTHHLGVTTKTNYPGYMYVFLKSLCNVYIIPSKR